MCEGFIDLNKACLKNFYPLPNIDNLVDATSRCTIFSFLDAFSEYNPILMWEEDWSKTTFIINKGVFYYKAIPFGLKNAESTY